MTQPGAVNDINDPNTPGTPFWWMSRLARRLMDRQPIYDIREAYASGDHPLPNGDRRYVKALRELQNKAKTNYISLIQQAATQKLRPKGFRFGTEGFADQDAQNIWRYNDMDFQAPRLIQKAAELGFCFAVVLPPDEPGGQPVIAYRDPRICEVEFDRNRPNKIKAAIEYWVDESIDQAFVILYLPEAIYYFQGARAKPGFLDELTDRAIEFPINSFQLLSVQENPIGVVPMVRCNWYPEAGEVGKASGEEVWEIQNRVNKTVLDRLVISNSQAYRQRWVTGAPKVAKGQKAPPWDPGADKLLMSVDPDTKFGEFSEADIKQILEAIRDDVGDMAAITQTPATFLINRMVNVSGDTLIQANEGHVARVRKHQDAVGWFFERLIKLAFLYLGDSRATDVTAQTLWWPLEQHSEAELADAFQKYVSGGIPLQLAMERAGVFTDEQIQFAVAEAERMRMEDERKEMAAIEAKEAARGSDQLQRGGETSSSE